MGIREDAQAAHAKVVEEREAAAKVQADREAVEAEGEKKLTTRLVSDWAEALGYGNRAVISDIRSQKTGGGAYLTTVLFQIDDVGFCGTRSSKQKLVVKLAEDRSLGVEITDLKTLGEALKQAEHRQKW